MTYAAPIAEAPSPPHAPGASRREMLLGGALLATAGATFALMPRIRVVALPGGDVARAIPDRAGAWHHVEDANFVLPPSDEQAAALVYEEQLTRAYDNGTDPTVMLLIAYDRTQSGLLQIHRPESCYPGSGFSITPSQGVPVPLGAGVVAQANFITATREERVEQVLYWTRLGYAFPRDWHDQRWAIAWQNLRGYVPDGALVRMSMITPDAEVGRRLLVRFAQMLFVSAGTPGRHLLGGPATV